MANYETLKAAIQQVVKTNGNNEITGALLQQSLLAMVNSLGSGYQFIDVATPDTKPGTPDQKVFYIANGKGTYSNFDGISITEDEVVILYYDTAWHKLLTGIASQAKLSELEEKLMNIQDVTSQVSIDKYIVASSGYDGGESTFSHSDYIAVHEGMKIHFYGYGGNNSVAPIYGYNENKQPVRALLTGIVATILDKEVTIGNDIKYVRLSYANATHSRYVQGSYFKIINEVLPVIKAEVEELQTRMAEAETKTAKTAESLYGNVLSLGEILSDTERWDNNTILGDSTSDTWYNFRNTPITIENGYIKIEGHATITYEGLRMSSSRLTNGRKYRVSFEYKTPSPLYFFIGTDYALLTTFVTDNEWHTISGDFICDDRVNRLQIALNATIATYYVRNISIVDLDWVSLNTRLTALEKKSETSAHPLKGKKIAVIGDSISTISGNNTPSWKVMSVDVGNTIDAWCTYYDINKVIGGKTITSAMVGTKQSFVPTAEDVGKEIGTASNYNASSIRVWSEQLCELAECELVCNASWSGSQLVKGQGENEDGSPKDNEYVGSYSWSDYTMSRFANNRDADGNLIIPDVIFIFRGTNDAIHTPHGYIGEWDMKDGIPTTDLLANGHRSYEKAANILVNKLRAMFPNVYIVFCTLNYFRRGTDLGWTRKFSANDTLAEYNDAIRNIANKLGCGLVEFDKDGISPFVNAIDFYADGSGSTPTHPNTNGHRVMAEKAFEDCKYIFKPTL